MIAALLLAAPATRAAPPASSDRPAAPAEKPRPPPSLDQPFNLPTAERGDAYGPRPQGGPLLTREQIVTYGLQNPLVRAADAQVEQMEATLLKAKFSWVPVIRTTTALAPGINTQCEDLSIQAADPKSGELQDRDFQLCRPAGGVDIDTVRGYFNQLSVAGVTLRFNADFVVPLYTFGKIKNGTAMARAGVALAQLAKERNRQETVLRVYQAHTALLLARESIVILDEAWTILQEAKAQIERDLGEGDDADPDEANPDRDPADLLRVELGELTLEERMVEARKIEAVALATLWAIAGTAAPQGFDIAERSLVPDAVAGGGIQPLPHYRDLGVQQRPEAKMAAGLVELRRAGEKFARSQFLPDFGLVFSVQIAYSNKADQGMRDLHYYDRFNYRRLVAALALNWNLDFHNQYFALKKARAERREAEHQRDAARLLLGLEVEKAYRDLVEADQSVKLTSQASKKARQLVVDQQVKQTVGGGNFAELEKALVRWAEWRFKHFEAIHAHNVALAGLSRAVGASLQAKPEVAGAAPATPVKTSPTP